MRLNVYEVDTIKKAVHNFDEHAQIILYGSRTDDTKKGGDIDILIISDKIKNKELRKIRLKLYDILGEQKIDIISTPEINSAFLNYAYISGIQL